MAGQMGYDDDSATVTDRGDWPRGCFGYYSANLFFNSDMGGNGSIGGDDSICRVVGMCGSPHVLCPQGMPDQFQPCPIGGGALHPG